MDSNIIDKSQIKIIIKALSSLRNETNSPEARKEIIEVASNLIGYIVTQNDPFHGKLIQKLKPILKKEHINFDEFLNKIQRSREFCKSLEIQVCGLHFVDPYIGRFSKIWNNYSAPRNFSKEDKPIFNKLYSDLWLRTYKQILKASTSLINAFYENMIQWAIQLVIYI